MDKPIIDEIIIASACGARRYKVGEVTIGKMEFITKIEEDSYETDNFICCLYNIYSGDKLVARIENCPVEIRYK